MWLIIAWNNKKSTENFWQWANSSYCGKFLNFGDKLQPVSLQMNLNIQIESTSHLIYTIKIKTCSESYFILII